MDKIGNSKQRFIDKFYANFEPDWKLSKYLDKHMVSASSGEMKDSKEYFKKYTQKFNETNRHLSKHRSIKEAYQ